MTKLEKRFWAKVRKSDSCWEWTAATRPDGYGVIGLGSRTEGIERSHRLSWSIHFGPIPDGLFVCHHCDNRRCVRPDHLFLGTAAENHHDMRSKSRHCNPPRLLGDSNPRRIRPPHGELNPAAKLNDQDARGVRALSSLGVSGAEIGRLIGISKTQVSKIVRWLSWA